MTIDKQLITFRKSVCFKHHIPSETDKFGIKLFLLRDCVSGYTYNGVPYAWKEVYERQAGLAEHVIT